ncbi:MAG: signal transduction histidine kinase [Salibacteraceae bacterium]
MFNVHCQEKSRSDLIKSEFKKFPISIKIDPNFKKAYLFFIEKEYDSTLVYSHHFIASHGLNDKYSNYCHYFRAMSFINKQLFTMARKEFEMLPKTFPLYFTAQSEMGTIALELGDYSKALGYFLEIKELSQEDQQYFKEGVLYHNIGVCYLHLEKFEESEEYLLEGLNLQEKEQNTSFLITSYMDIANLYYAQYKDDLAIPFFEKAYALSKKTKNFELKQNAALNMAVVEENRKDYLKSIAYRKEYEIWKDSINDQNKILAVAQLEKKFISEKKQKEIEILEKDNSIKKAQRNNFIYSSILLSLLAVALFYFYRSKKKVNKVILAQKVTLDALNDTKDRLFSIVSHDLRSNVNAIDRNNSKLTESFKTQEYKEIGPQIEQGNALTNSTKALLDNMLNWALLQTEQMYFQQEDLSLRSIVNHVTHNYEPLLNSKNIALKIDIPPSMFVYADSESLKIVFRNVIDNAIKFSVAGDQISIYTNAQSHSHCQLIIEDTGTGMSNDVLTDLLGQSKQESKKINKERTGLGLHLCQSMMLKNDGELDIESEENVGTKLIFSIPKTKAHEQD